MNTLTTDVLIQLVSSVGIGGIFLWLFLRLDARVREREDKYDEERKALTERFEGERKDLETGREAMRLEKVAREKELLSMVEALRQEQVSRAEKLTLIVEHVTQAMAENTRVTEKTAAAIEKNTQAFDRLTDRIQSFVSGR